MTSVNEIRRAFLDFFKKQGHEVVPSSPLVPRNDPTLMFTNAGMVQFKNVFTGQETRPYNTAASSQKCVRAGGKHNDLDNVGYTARHHTFFEMLGNFSFGDYFKERAIELAWNLLVQDFGIDKKRLTITVYHTDEDAFRIWKKLTGFGADKILRIATNDNFWQMGDTGPCGPCSEIFYDHGDKIAGGPPGSADADGDRFVEIWNLVFMQYEQIAPGERVDLPKHSVDTGMGLERLAAVLQGTHDNYEIDLFKALIAASVAATGVPATGENRASHRVIADHLRATSFLIADGVLPSNEGRGYVLRRIMRRAMRHAHLLGATEPLMYRLVPALVHEMGDTYHELQRAQPLITETLELEEKRFKRTLEKGLGLLEDATGDLKKGAVLSGDTAFKLYDTFGFPLDLTEDALRPRGISVDTKAFDAAMERQKAEARKAWKGSGEAATETIWFQLKEKAGATEFLGYEAETATGEIVALVKDGKEVKSLKAGDEAVIVVNQTPFYGESGGQVGDEGIIRGKGEALFRVTDTQKKAGGLFVHQGKVEKGAFKAGDEVDLQVEHARRSATRANHSATHLLHEALRQVLGPHVAQKGSLVAPDRLRFDFSHTKPMTPEEVAAVEARANAIVLQNAPVETRLMALEDALEFGRHGAVRREVRRRGPRRFDGRSCRRRARKTLSRRQQGLVGRAVRRHARDAHRRHWPRQDHRRERERVGRAPHRGVDRRRRARLPRRAGRAPARGGVPSARAARGRGCPRQGAGRRAKAARAPAQRRQEAVGARRRHGGGIRHGRSGGRHQDRRQSEAHRAYRAGAQPEGPARPHR